MSMLLVRERDAVRRTGSRVLVHNPWKGRNFRRGPFVQFLKGRCWIALRDALVGSSVRVQCVFVY